jgi:hypothetical protein
MGGWVAPVVIPNFTPPVTFVTYVLAKKLNVEASLNRAKYPLEPEEACDQLMTSASKPAKTASLEWVPLSEIDSSRVPVPVIVAALFRTWRAPAVPLKMVQVPLDTVDNSPSV